ncbi:hypothetical protein DI396_15800 [Litorivita pollutaquae]|uniref:Uncharacterized protein n=1 Tax=Litorivita pollutaquae TaxID=2200892 RepID=A0A2V4NJQ0_9RHOB|nr:hypothetical protein DI396_15800 [Litorivita pollutaquae]
MLVDCKSEAVLGSATAFAQSASPMAMYGSQRFFCFSVAVAQTIVRTVGGVNHVAKARNPFAAMLLFQNPPVVAKITARAAYPSGINAHYLPVSTAWFQ